MSYRPFHLAILAAASLVIEPQVAGSLRFAAEVPDAPAELPLLRLRAQAAPVDLINRVLVAGGSQKLAALGETPFFRRNNIRIPAGVVGVVERETVKAWADMRSGEAAIYPTLSKLKPISPADVERLTSVARDIFASPQMFPHDDTRSIVDKPQTLNGATLLRVPRTSTRTDKKAQYAVYVSARRYVGNFPVDGPGSRALLTIGNGGSVEGLSRVWKTANIVERVRKSLSPTEVRAEIARQLRPALRNSDIVVDRIELAYYDGNKAYLQPVFRFTARIHHITPNAEARTSDDFVIGYIPFARAIEALPSLDKVDGPNPATAASNRVTQPRPPENDPIVGRYVVRNDDAGWVNNANAFWNSLASSWTRSLFTNSQYYWAEPRLFTTQKNSFINAMNLALIEVHGDWWLYSTLMNCCDLVNINGDIPSPGYGPSANGKLADWIIHSCEVVPAPDDTPTWPDTWWNIFGGVRNVVGYRTIMYINDAAGGPYGSSLGHVAPVVSSWLSDVISLNAYSGRRNSAAHGGVSRPMGLPSTISMCGHDGESVFSTSSLGRANCLTVWWFPD